MINDPGSSICGALPTAVDEDIINSTAAPLQPQQNHFYNASTALNAGGRPLVNASNTGGGSGALTSAGTNGGLGRSSYEGSVVPRDPSDNGGPQ